MKYTVIAQDDTFTSQVKRTSKFNIGETVLLQLFGGEERRARVTHVEVRTRFCDTELVTELRYWVICEDGTREEMSEIDIKAAPPWESMQSRTLKKAA